MINEIVRKISDKEKNHSAAEAAFICTALTLTFTFWRFEGYISQRIMSVLNIIAGAMMVCGWLYFSFAQGVKEKSGFAVFTALFWILPTLLFCYSDSVTDPKKFDIRIFVSGELSKLLGGYALGGLPWIRELNAAAAAVLFSSVCIIVHIAGIFCAKKMKK
ncbi:MAG: hypothetical protein MSJ26_04200 [Oscillospiraceae bacterium]|nr:hypothetical protein [Oscillospiraceae bacterium]